MAATVLSKVSFTVVVAIYLDIVDVDVSCLCDDVLDSVIEIEVEGIVVSQQCVSGAVDQNLLKAHSLLEVK